AAQVQLVLARTTCPGRYIAVVAGDTGSVKSAVEAGLKTGASMVVDWFILPSVHPDVIPALSGCGSIESINALGVIETCTTVSCILAADAAAKTAAVTLLEIRFAAGLAGKAFVTMSGDVASVQAAVEAGIAGVGEAGPVLSHVVIPSPSKEFKAQLL
ncbi:BMC domain-containing protein, partial [Desulfovibrio sp. OttesenSCG-928-F07]|nr:BMC domain-containing protein [Desulfovibrio sp. OttesenSCG-928-F07]